MKARVVLAPSARDQLRDLIRWWRENRPWTGRHLPVEVKRVLKLLAEFPNLGQRYEVSGRPNLRRIRLRKTPYHLYHEPGDEPGVVLVVAAWSGVREEGPPLE